MMIKRLTFFALVPVSLVASLSLQAAEWTRSAGVAPGVVYTDNVCLDPDDEQGEWIATATPDVAIQGNGRRASVSLAGSVEVNSLTDSKLDNLGCNPAGFGNREQFAPRLNGTAYAELIEDWFYLDTQVSANQNEINSFRGGGGDSLDTRGNTNTTYRYDINPYVARRFKDTARLRLSYAYSDEYNTADIVGGSAQHTADILIDNSVSGSKLSWGLQGDYSKIDYDENENRATDTDESELKSAQFNLGYQVNRSWQINGYYGQEWNDFVSEADDIDGDYWDAGLRWTPNARTTIEAGTGNRFFGDTERYSIDYRHKRRVFSLDYSEELTYDRNIRTLDNSLPGSPVDPGDPTTLSNSPILDKRLTVGYRYVGRRTTFGLSGSHSDQQRAEDGRDSTFQGASISLSRSIARRLSISGSIDWDKQEPKGERSDFVTESETWRATLGLQKQLTQDVDLSLDYQYTDRQSDIELDEYQENRVTLSIRFNLI